MRRGRRRRRVPENIERDPARRFARRKRLSGRMLTKTPVYSNRRCNNSILIMRGANVYV